MTHRGPSPAMKYTLAAATSGSFHHLVLGRVTYRLAAGEHDHGGDPHATAVLEHLTTVGAARPAPKRRRKS